MRAGRVWAAGGRPCLISSSTAPVEHRTGGHRAATAEQGCGPAAGLVMPPSTHGQVRGCLCGEPAALLWGAAPHPQQHRAQGPELLSSSEVLKVHACCALRAMCFLCCVLRACGHLSSCVCCVLVVATSGCWEEHHRHHALPWLRCKSGLVVRYFKAFTPMNHMGC